MNKLTYIFFVLIVLSSCSDKTKKNDDIDKTSVNEINQIDSLKQHFIPIINGVWVLTDYVNDICKTKSPLKSSDKLDGVVTLIINTTNLSDSIEVGVSLNNHEGYNFTTYFIEGQNQNSLKTNFPDYDNEMNFYELGYESRNNEHFLVLYHYDKFKKIIGKKRYMKVANNHDDNDAAWGIQYIVNDKLFSGNYLLIDSTKSSVKIKLNNDGSIKGHSDFKSYYVFTDFVGGPETIIDGIAFNLNEVNSKSFAFKIQNDTIFLYSTIGNEEMGDELKIGRLQYKLVKQ